MHEEGLLAQDGVRWASQAHQRYKNACSLWVLACWVEEAVTCGRRCTQLHKYSINMQMLALTVTC